MLEMPEKLLKLPEKYLLINFYFKHFNNQNASNLKSGGITNFAILLFHYFLVQQQAQHNE
jgi:hypothetical protein